MRLLERLTRLLKADAHGVLEHLEEWALLAKQHVREAELELDRKRAQADALDEEARRLATDLGHLEREVETLDADVELALGGEDEELARYAVRRLLPKRVAAESARRRMQELAEQLARLQEIIGAQESQLEELRGRVRAQLASARAGSEGDLRVAPRAADEEVELELLRRRRARAGVS